MSIGIGPFGMTSGSDTAARNAIRSPALKAASIRRYCSSSQSWPGPRLIV